jgi:hypothetical protein
VQDKEDNELRARMEYSAIHVYNTNYYYDDAGVCKATLSDSRPMPANPILAQAQQRGLSQRQIEKLTQRGRPR